ncbi:MAG TPA: SLATT domain-containing protein [Anaerolineales bacterium]|nr:SLATT domain-containing protein [Anaerolineales bacterium]
MNGKNGGDLANRPQGTIESKTQPYDISVPKLRVQTLKWTTADEIQGSVVELYQYAEACAWDSIDWYGKRKRWKAWMSQLLRCLAIIFTTIGGLMPIIGALGVSNVTLPGTARQFSLGHVGYLFLGLAAASIAFDRFFGFSSGWMRYITTKMTLERMLSEFRFDWAMMVAKLGERSPTTDQVQLMIQRIKEFLVSVNSNVEQETQTWISEFKTNLAEIEKAATKQAEAARPGAIDITVTNGMDTEDGFTVTLDGMEVRKVRGTKYQIGYVPPGPHKIAVSGSIKGEQLDASELANVAPGEIANVTLALPVKEAQP